MDLENKVLSEDRARAWELPNWVEPALVVGLVLVALLVQGLNTTHAPTLTRLDDEGIYVSQAWSVLREGHLSPYTYFYDHAPVGWIMIAIWMAIVGGPHAFGAALDTGRILMLLLHAAMVPMLYYLARKLTASIPMAGLAALLFSVSPLALNYQRMIILDNPMMFWLLISITLLVAGRGKPLFAVFSGISFALACLSKEPAIGMFPALLFLFFLPGLERPSWKNILSWAIPAILVLCIYPLYAAARGELFPSAPIPGYTPPPGAIFSTGKVNLYEALKWQLTRPGGGSIFSPNSMFWQQVRTNWIPEDFFLFLGGIISVLINLVRGFRNRLLLAASLLGLLPLIYLAHGGIVYDFYIVFALPFFALNIGLTLDWLVERFWPRPAGKFFVAEGLMILLLAIYVISGQMKPLYQTGPDQPNRQALAWILNNIDSQSRVVIPDAFWVDLHEPTGGKAPFLNANSYWKISSETSVRDNLLHNDWHNIDYVILTQGMRQDLQNSGDTLTLQALSNATQVQRWAYGPLFVEVWKVNK